MKCTTCVYGLTCSRPDSGWSVSVLRSWLMRRSECLDENYMHYKEGDPQVRLLKLQRSGEINIVIGAEGEHEVNINWTIDKAYANLAETCEACGGLVVKESLTQLLLMKAYGPSFVIEWMHDKLYKISIREHTIWWEAEG